MSLIDQNHDLKLSKRNGPQIYLNGERFPITINMPNYHLFASTASIKLQKTTNMEKNKSNIPLELLYMRIGCGSIKTLISANTENLWNDINVTLTHDIISETNHHNATIRKTN